jgi:hypothetical protein
MSVPRSALVLMGSPKAARSNSASLGAYLVERLVGRGVQARMLSVCRGLRSPEAAEALLDAADGADRVVLASPLYVDSLPSGVIRALELLAGRQRRGAARFAAVINCGFPEAAQTQTALAICRRFAAEAGFEWAGGLGLGMGEAIGGRPLKEAGRRARKARRALELAGDALAAGLPIPEQAVNLMARPMTPRWLYILLGNRGWKRRARKHDATERLNDRPHQP